jgi:hypothetical protein
VPYPCRFSYRLARTVGLLLLVILALVPSLAALARPISSTPALPAQLRSAADAPFTVFVPMARRPRPPLGMIIQPSELMLAKAQYDARLEPARTAVRSLFKNAGEAMADTPCAVATYTTSAGYDCLNRASENAYLLALAYRMTGNTAYSDKGAAFIHAWMDTLTSVDMSDDQANLDWSRLMPAMIWGADLLTSTPSWGEGDRAAFMSFVRKYALPQAKLAAQRRNNWADAGNLLWLSVAVYANMPSERDAAVANWKKLLNGQPDTSGAALSDKCIDSDWVYGMCRDGSITEENRRDDALSYNQAAMSMKTVFAEIRRRQGDGSLYTYRTPRGVGLKNGWDFLAPKVVDAFAGRCSWPYSANHCVPEANRSGWEVAYAYWRSPAYLPVLAEHRPYTWSNWADPGYSTALYGSLNLLGQ